MAIRARLVTVILTAFFALAVRAEHPTKERGFRADGAYHLTDLDTVNLFNGSVNIALPIVQPYPVSSNLTYAFSLRYAGNVWTETEVCVDGHIETCRIHYTPQPDNAGFGWHLSFGELTQGFNPTTSTDLWSLMTPDGSKHRFYESLHPGEPRVLSVWYTRDSTYLRLKELSSTLRLVEFPNGTRHLYERDATLSTQETPVWDLKYIYDSHSAVSGGVPTSNFILFTYAYRTDADPQNRTWIERWTVTDSVGRTHYVHFRTAASFSSPPVIDKIDLQAFNNARAVYDFGYNNPTDDGVGELGDGTPQAVSRPCRYADDTATVTAHFLHKIRLAKGSPNSATEQFTSFVMTYDEGTAPACRDTPGLMKSMILPTGAKHVWTYRQYNFAGPRPYDASQGVEKRLVFDKDGVEGKLVQYRKYVANASGNNVVETMKVPGTSPSETDSVDYKTVNFFTAEGLPYTTAVTDGSAQQRNLSSETFECNENASGESCNATPERRQYVKYDFDCTFTCEPDRNARLVAERTQFTSDSSVFVDTERSSFDGLGHYRTMTTRGFSTDDGPRTETTNYNPDSGTYPGSFTMVPPTDAWLLETFVEKSATEGDITRKSQYCFDVNTFPAGQRDTAKGSLLRARTLKEVSAGTADVVAVYEYDNVDGNLATERYYGGDNQAIDTSSLCGLTLPATAQYRVAHAYAYGARSSTQYITSNGAPIGFKSADYDIDQSTGVIKASRDTAGRQTSFEFDALGRLTWEKPSGAAYTEVQYRPPTSSANAQVTVRSRPNGQTTGIPLTETEYTYDTFGRLWRERTKMPDGTWNRRETGYDWAGRTAQVTEFVADSSGGIAPSTTYSYDLFGRRTVVTPPDGAAHNVTTAYTGIRKISRTAKVKTGSGETDATTTETYDGLGRLREVQENSGTTGGLVTTSYRYEPTGKLTYAGMKGDGLSQYRVFDYDGRGFLRWESQPESGMKSYTYDARGHTLTSEVGGAKSLFDLRFTYDEAERLRTVEARDPGNPDLYRSVKEFQYGTVNITPQPPDPPGPTDYCLGKLVSAARYNYNPEPASGFPSSTVRVTETFAYKDGAGRLTDRTTVMAAAWGTSWLAARSITQRAAYDDLGRISAISYPMCPDCGTPPGNPWRNIASTYTNGKLTQLSEFVNNISYWPNGMRHVLQHSNGMEDTQNLDVSGMPRPGMLKSETYKPCRAPIITSQTLGAVRKPTDPYVELVVSATGSETLSYNWYDATVSPATLIQSGGASIRVTPTSTAIYYAEVGNECRTVRSKTITVKYGDCVAPWIAEATATRNANGTFVLSAAAFGTEPLSYTWRLSSDPGVVVGTSATVTTGVLSSTTQYTVEVTNGCGGSVATAYVTADVPVSIASMTVTASTVSSTEIAVTWTAVSGATEYRVERRTGTTWSALDGCNSLGCNDRGVSAATAYAYRVTAYKNSTIIGRSASDVATTLTYTQVARGMEVSATVFNQLLSGVNAVRALSGWLPVTWSNILAATDPLPNPRQIISSRHLLALRSRLNEAVQAIGVPLSGYTNPDLQGVIISATHVTEIQERLR